MAAPHADGELRIEVVDSATGQPIAARMHLSTGRKAGARVQSKRPVKLNLPGTAEFGGHFYIDGAVTLPLRIGQYTFELEADPGVSHADRPFRNRTSRRRLEANRNETLHRPREGRLVRRRLGRDPQCQRTCRSSCGPRGCKTSTCRSSHTSCSMPSDRIRNPQSEIRNRNRPHALRLEPARLARQTANSTRSN